MLPRQMKVGRGEAALMCWSQLLALCEGLLLTRVDGAQGNILLSIGAPKCLIVAADLFVVWPSISAQAAYLTSVQRPCGQPRRGIAA